MENSEYAVIIMIVLILIIVFIILYFTWYVYWKIRDFEDDWCETRKVLEDIAKLAHDCCDDKSSCDPTPQPLKQKKPKKKGFFG